MRLFVFIIIALGVWISVATSSSIDLIDGKCLSDSSCKVTEYCERDFPNPFGSCVAGHEESHSCLFDRHCASKRCHYFRCKKRIQIRNGPCKISADCPDDQFCDDIKDRDDLRQCFNRKCVGTCRKDSQCLSDKCHLFTCVRADNC